MVDNPPERFTLKIAVGSQAGAVCRRPNPDPEVVLGDSPQAAAEGLKADQIASGQFVLARTRHHVLIVGDPAGVLHGIEPFLAIALNYIPDGTTATGTDLIVPPMPNDADK